MAKAQSDDKIDMADIMELIQMSMGSIKKIDPYVKEVQSAATQVALYKFNVTLNEWERCDTEGAMFVYSRYGEPYHSIMIMNRMNSVNVLEPIVKDFEYQMQIPFLLYKNSKKEIYGVWFFNRQECITATYRIEKIMEKLRGKTGETSSTKKENGVDIFSMLTKAQEDFNKTPTKQTSVPSFSSTPRVPDVTSKSVMDFFAKASTKSNGSGPVATKQNVLQRLMSNPAHSVEHIEKQQRSVTPQDQPNLRQEPFPADRRSVPISFPGDKKLEDSLRVEDASVIQPSVSPLMSLIQNASSVSDDTDKSFDKLQKPQLMTPMMFQTATKDSTEGASSLVDDRQDHVDLLTENQLAQALIYLLKHDSNFTKQIHEAYVSSLMESLKLSNKTKI